MAQPTPEHAKGPGKGPAKGPGKGPGKGVSLAPTSGKGTAVPLEKGPSPTDPIGVDSPPVALPMEGRTPTSSTEQSSPPTVLPQKGGPPATVAPLQEDELPKQSKGFLMMFLRHCRQRCPRALPLEMLTLPLCIMLGGMILERFPERICELHLQLDLRGAVLLISTVATAVAVAQTPKTDAEDAKEVASEASASDIAAAIEELPTESVRQLGADDALKVLEAVPEQLLERLVEWQPESENPGAIFDLKSPSADLAAAKCKCSACNEWSGQFADLHDHIMRCMAAQCSIAIRSFRAAAGRDQKFIEMQRERAPLDALHADMMGSSPVLLHRFPARAFSSTSGHWCTPPFTACERLWALRMGLAEKGCNSHYFNIFPIGHSERLMCSCIFARRPGEGYKERRVHDWPVELAGQPWGPTLLSHDIASFIQADGSMLLMIHAIGLCETEESAWSPPLDRALNFSPP